MEISAAPWALGLGKGLYFTSLSEKAARRSGHLAVRLLFMTE